MRVAVLVYVLLYLALELLGAQFAALDWHLVTPLMVASAITDAVLVVSVLVAVLVTADLTRRRWRPAMRTWRHPRGRPHPGRWDPDRTAHDAGVVGVPSWRPTPTALPAVPRTATRAEPTYAVGGPARPRRPFPEDEGTLL